MIIYKLDTGEILDNIPDSQSIEGFYYHYPQEFKDNLGCIYGDYFPNELLYYRVLDGELIRKTEQEISDIQQFGKILTEEDRVNLLLQPSYEEIAKAENTIEILSLLEEVGLI